LCETLRMVLAELNKIEAERDPVLPPNNFFTDKK